MWGQLFFYFYQNCWECFSFLPKELKYLISSFHWGRFFLLINVKTTWSEFDWVVVLEFCCEPEHLGTHSFRCPFIPCIMRYSENRLMLTALKKWEYPKTYLFCLRQQLQHSTNQLAKETNELLKELGSLPLPLSTSEQVGIFWGFDLFILNKKNTVFFEEAICETNLAFTLNLSFLIHKMDVSIVTTERMHVPDLARY